MAKLNSILHQELRLAIISFLVNVEWVEFKKLSEVTGATKGNLSVQISKLKKAEYLEVRKSFRGNYPLTECQITDIGRKAFEGYVVQLKRMLNL